MVLTKNQAKVLQVFCGHITELFTLREVARVLDMHVSLAHRAIKPLVKRKILAPDRQRRLSLNYRENHGILAYAEYLRREELLGKARNKDLALFISDVMGKIEEDCFVLLLFGSAVTSDRPRDIDILLIVDSIGKIEFHERFLHTLADTSPLKLETRVISFESVYEMLAKRDQRNLMNEVLNKHIIMHGAETFYRLVTKGRT